MVQLLLPSWEQNLWYPLNTRLCGLPEPIWKL